MSDIHDHMNKIDNRLTAIESAQPLLQDLLNRNIATEEKLGETLHEMQTSIALMNTKMDSQAETFDARMDAQAEAFDGLKSDMKKQTDETETAFKMVNDRVASIEDKGNFDIYGFIKAKLPWIIILIGLGISALSKYITI